MLVPPHPMMTEEPTCELKGPSPATEDSSTVDVAMGLGSILFVDSEAGPPRQEKDNIPTDKVTSLLGD